LIRDFHNHWRGKKIALSDMEHLQFFSLAHEYGLWTTAHLPFPANFLLSTRNFSTLQRTFFPATLSSNVTLKRWRYFVRLRYKRTKSGRVRVDRPSQAHTDRLFVSCLVTSLFYVISIMILILIMIMSIIIIMIIIIIIIIKVAQSKLILSKKTYIFLIAFI